jgi:predicted kinase
LTTLPVLLLVTGASGTGKTQLAHALAAAIGCPAICRDEIKEGMVLTYGDGFTPAPGDALTRRTFPLFFDVLRLVLEGGVSVIAEAAFQDRVWRMGLEPVLPLASLRVIRCTVSDDLARRRRFDRGRDKTRRAHVDADPGVLTPSAFDALSLSAPLLIVDTTDGYVPCLEDIAAFGRGV